jgi:hypothetical protein
MEPGRRNSRPGCPFLSVLHVSGFQKTVSAIALAAVVLAVWTVLSRREMRAERRGGASKDHTVSVERASPPAPGKQQAGFAESAVGIPQKVRGAPAPPPRGDRSLLLLTASLESGSAISTATSGGEARIGIGEISREDVGERDLWLKLEERGAGAHEFEELVNVRQWLPANLSGEDAGVLRVGPAEVPSAPAFDVLAWEPDFSWGYRRVPGSKDDATTIIDAGLLPRHTPTGVRLRLAGEQDEYEARLERVPADDPGPASSQLALLRQMAPALAGALAESDPVFLSAKEENLLVPLVPDRAVRVILLSASGVESSPTLITLSDGQVVDATIDASRVFKPASSALVRLEGTLEIGESGEPLAGARVSRPGRDTGGGEQETDARGSFRFEGLPMVEKTRFVAGSPAVGAGRPLVPARWEFEFDPRGETTGSTVRRTWRVPALRWLVLDLASPDGARVKLTRHPPYPVFVLQSYDVRQKVWSDASAEHFITEGESMAVSVGKDGSYRVAVAMSPCAVVPSLEARISSSNPEATVTLAVKPADVSFTIRAVESETGNPVEGATVTVAGPHRSLPPLRLVSNQRGEAAVPLANCDRAFIRVEKQGFSPVEREYPVRTAMETEIRLERGRGGLNQRQ